MDPPTLRRQTLKRLKRVTGLSLGHLPDEMLEDFREGRLKGDDLVMIGKMMDKACGRKDSCWYAFETLVEDLGKSKATVHRMLARVRKTGWVGIEELLGGVDPDDPTNWTGYRRPFYWLCQGKGCPINAGCGGSLKKPRSKRDPASGQLRLFKEQDDLERTEEGVSDLRPPSEMRGGLTQGLNLRPPPEVRGGLTGGLILRPNTKSESPPSPPVGGKSANVNGNASVAIPEKNPDETGAASPIAEESDQRCPENVNANVNAFSTITIPERNPDEPTSAAANAQELDQPGPELAPGNLPELSSAAMERMANAMIEDLRERGMTFELRGLDQFGVKLRDATTEPLTDQERTELTWLKPGIIALLRQEQDQAEAAAQARAGLSRPGAQTGGPYAPPVTNKRELDALFRRLKTDPDDSVCERLADGMVTGFRDTAESHATFLSMAREVRAGKMADACFRGALDYACKRKIKHRGKAFISEISRRRAEEHRRPDPRAGPPGP